MSDEFDPFDVERLRSPEAMAAEAVLRADIEARRKGNIPPEPSRFRDGVNRLDMAEYLDKCADGVVGGDDLVNAVRAALSNSTRHKPAKEAADAA